MAKWLTISDVQNLLHVPESTIQRWVRQGNLPCTERAGKFYFNREILLSWAEAKEIHVEKKDLSRKKPSRIEKHKWQELKKAMERGGLHQLEGGSDWKTLFREATGLLNYDTTSPGKRHCNPPPTNSDETGTQGVSCSFTIFKSTGRFEGS